MVNQNIGFLIKVISDRMKALGDNDLREHDLTFSQMQVLAAIEHEGGTIAQKEIEKILDVSHPTIVGLINRLQDKGFVTCETDETDHRSKIVTLTPKAVSLGRTMREKRDQSERGMLEGLSDEEIGQLNVLLRKLYSNMEERKV
ncbi:MAG: MarR family transcriptional regulator [Lachnospiraceae bacterium]|nr:MarR family transcriptional regulator [Lachnospiraceae bacterium]